MTDSLKFELVSPERLLKDMQAVEVVVPGSEGDFGVLPGHAPVMTALRPGVVSVTASDGDTAERLFVKGGLAQVGVSGLTILAEEAMDMDGIDADELKQKLADTREDIEDAEDDVEKARLIGELEWMTALSEALAA